MSKRGRQVASEEQCSDAFKVLRQALGIKGLEMVYERGVTTTGETSKVTFLGDSRECAARGLPRAPLGLEGMSGAQFLVTVETMLRLLPFASVEPEGEVERIEE
jgi:hypothetical protein